MSAANVFPIRPAVEAGDRAHSFQLSDYGNAERLARDYGDQLRYAYDAGHWLTWDDTRWIRDTTGATMRFAKMVVRRLYTEAGWQETDAERREVVRHAVQSEREARIRGMLALAQSECPFPVLIDHFDADPWLLNCLNGTIDLRTGELRGHSRADLISKSTGTAYDAEASCPRWERFLADVMGDDIERLLFLQKAAGYCATGITSEQCFFAWYGSGANGKTTAATVLREVLGDYALSIDAESLMVRRGVGPREDLARLKGARFVSAVESSNGARLDEGLIKNLTGSDPITCRHLYAGSFSFVPTFKILLSTNHRPVIRDSSVGMWRRVRLLPFTVTIPEERRDANLLRDLLAEREGILAWVVAGARQWQRAGLGMPSAVRDATAAYRADSDALGAFLEERCEIAPKARERGSALYAAFQRWAEASGERNVLSSTAFGRALEERGHDVKKERDAKYRLGLRLRVPSCE